MSDKRRLICKQWQIEATPDKRPSWGTEEKVVKPFFRDGILSLRKCSRLMSQKWQCVIKRKTALSYALCCAEVWLFLKGCLCHKVTSTWQFTHQLNGDLNDWEREIGTQNTAKNCCKWLLCCWFGRKNWVLEWAQYFWPASNIYIGLFAHIHQERGHCKSKNLVSLMHIQVCVHRVCFWNACCDCNFFCSLEHMFGILLCCENWSICWLWQGAKECKIDTQTVLLKTFLHRSNFFAWNNEKSYASSLPHNFENMVRHQNTWWSWPRSIRTLRSCIRVDCLTACCQFGVMRMTDDKKLDTKLLLAKNKLGGNYMFFSHIYR